MGRDFTDDIDDCCEAIVGGLQIQTYIKLLKLLCQNEMVIVLRVIE